MKDCTISRQLEAKLSEYLTRIEKEEDLHKIKQDFDHDFASYSCYDIINAKEELVKKGVDTFPLHLIFSPHDFLGGKSEDVHFCTGKSCLLSTKNKKIS